jgi:acetylxylan esterase
VTNPVTVFANERPDAMCGGSDLNQGISGTAASISIMFAAKVQAMIWMGDPRHTPGEPYNIGTSTTGGVSVSRDHGKIATDQEKFDPRPSGFVCKYSSMIQSYCNASDPYCSNGNNAATHQGYGTEYGQAALTFVNSKL